MKKVGNNRGAHNKVIDGSLFSVLTKGWRFAKIAYTDDSKRYRRKQQWKILYHAFFSPYFAYKWFDLIESGNLNFAFKYRPTLYIKPFRVYMSTRWNKKQKVKVIKDTYHFVLQHSDVFMPFLKDSSLPIAHLQLTEEIDAHISIGYNYRYRKEGELVMILDCEKLGGTISSGAFSFEKIETGQWICRIGCVQGSNKKQDSVSSVKAAQKLLHGLRPKTLVVYAIQEFIRQFAFVALYGASDSIQAYRRKHAIHIQFLHHIHFDYDTFWQESGGQFTKGGWYELPLTMERKDIKDFKTSKRAIHRHQYEMLDNISQQINHVPQYHITYMPFKIKSTN